GVRYLQNAVVANRAQALPSLVLPLMHINVARLNSGGILVNGKSRRFVRADAPFRKPVEELVGRHGDALSYRFLFYRLSVPFQRMLGEPPGGIGHEPESQ